jgi:hypothetical protein
MAQFTFNADFDTDRGTYDFTIKTMDGSNAFVDSDGNPIDFVQLPNQVGSNTWAMDLAPGRYEIFLVVVTNVNFNFSVVGPVLSISPSPATINSSTTQIYVLTV